MPASALIDELYTATGMRFCPITTGGGCTALAASTETGHEILVTDGDAHTPTAHDATLRISAHSPDSGEVLVTDHAPSMVGAASLLLSVLARIPHHDAHFDSDGTIYCDHCPESTHRFREALGLI